MLTRASLKRIGLAFAVLATSLAIVGLFLPAYVDDALHEGILKAVVWRPDSPPDVDARFRGDPEPPPSAHANPDLFRVWLWNITNLEAVRQGQKPRMEEVGPLTYVKRRVKVEAMWDRRGRVRVKEWDYHVFRPDLSYASPSAHVCVPNLALLGVLELLHARAAVSPAVQTLIDVVVGVLAGWRDEHVDGLFVRRTAEELIWGYDDTLLQRLAMLLGPGVVPRTRVQLLTNDSSAEDVAARKAPNVIDTGWRPRLMGRQGQGQQQTQEQAWQQGRRGEKEGQQQGNGREGEQKGGVSGAAAEGVGGGRVEAGAEGEWLTAEEMRRELRLAAGAGWGRLGRLGLAGGGGGLGSGWLPWRRWREMYDEAAIWNMVEEAGWSAVTAWGPNCTERVRGTDAFQFRPRVARGQQLRAWIAELFRSAALRFEGDQDLHGVTTWRYVPDPAEAQPDPCHHQTIPGLANITVPSAVGPTGNGSSDAAHSVPLLVSLPHYCQAEPSLAAALEGVACDPARHTTFLDVEPNTGITLRAAKRLQLSTQVSPASAATLEPHLSPQALPLTLPVFWAEEASEASRQQADSLRHSVYRAQALAANTRRWAFPAAVVAAAAAAMVLGLLLRRPAVAEAEGGGPAVGGGLVTHGSAAAGGGATVGHGSGGGGARSVAVTAVGVSEEGAGGLREPLLGDGGVEEGPGGVLMGGEAGGGAVGLRAAAPEGAGLE